MIGLGALFRKKQPSADEPVTIFSSKSADDGQDTSTQTEYHAPETISEAFQNPRYQNKIVIESQEGLFSTTQSERAIKKFKALHKKYPEDPPVMTVIPKGTQVSVPIETGLEKSE